MPAGTRAMNKKERRRLVFPIFGMLNGSASDYGTREYAWAPVLEVLKKSTIHLLRTKKV